MDAPDQGQSATGSSIRRSSDCLRKKAISLAIFTHSKNRANPQKSNANSLMTSGKKRRYSAWTKALC